MCSLDWFLRMCARSASRNTTPTSAGILKSFFWESFFLFFLWGAPPETQPLLRRQEFSKVSQKYFLLFVLCTARSRRHETGVFQIEFQIRNQNRFSVNRVQFPYITAGNCRRLTDRETCSFRISNSIWIKKKSVSQTEKRVESEFRIRFDVLIPNFEFDLENSSLTSAETSHVRRWLFFVFDNFWQATSIAVSRCPTLPTPLGISRCS